MSDNTPIKKSINESYKNIAHDSLAELGSLCIKNAQYSCVLEADIIMHKNSYRPCSIPVYCNNGGVNFLEPVALNSNSVHKVRDHLMVNLKTVDNYDTGAEPLTGIHLMSDYDVHYTYNPTRNSLPDDVIDPLFVPDDASLAMRSGQNKPVSDTTKQDVIPDYVLAGVYASIGLIGYSIFTNTGYREPQSDKKSMIHGTVAAGPLLPEHGIEVAFYSLDEDISVYYSKPDERGYYTLDANLLTPGIYLVKAIDISDKPDYRDETTGFPKDMMADLITIASISDQKHTQLVNINPLTTIVSNTLLSDHNSADITRKKITDNNNKIAEAFGLRHQAIHEMPVKPFTQQDGQLNPDTNILGKLLAIISASASSTDGSNLVDTISKNMSPEGLKLSNDDIQTLIDRAVVIGERLNIDIASEMITLLSQDKTLPLITFNKDKTDGNLSLTESLSNTGQTIQQFSGMVSTLQPGDYISVVLSDGEQTLVPDVFLLDRHWETELIDMSGLNEGDFTITVSVIDSSGNALTQQDIIHVNTRPDEYDDISFNVFTTDNIINSGERGHFIVSGNTTNIPDQALLKIHLIDRNNNQVISQTLVKDNRFNTGIIDIEKLESGIITIMAGAYSQGANFVKQSDTFLLDTVISDIGFDYQFKNQTHLNDENSTGFIVSGVGRSQEDSDNEVIITISDKLKTVVSKAVIDDGKWVSPPIDIGSLSDGTIQVSAEISDYSGNVSSTVLHNLIKDVSQPTVRIKSIQSNSYINKAMGKYWVLEGTVEGAENGIVNLAITSGEKTLLRPAKVEGSRWWIELMNMDQFVTGNVTVVAEAIDSFGNRSPSVSLTLLADFIQPEIKLVQDAKNSITADQLGNWILEGTVDLIDDQQALDIEVTDGSRMISTRVLVDNNRWITEPFDLRQFSDDLLTVTLNIKDSAGNQADEYQVGYYIDDGPPIINMNKIGNNNTVNMEQSINVIPVGTVSGIHDSERLVIKLLSGLNEREYEAEVNNGIWSAEGVNFHDFEDGEIILTARINDSGNMYLTELKEIIDLDTKGPGINLGLSHYPDKKVSYLQAEQFNLPVFITDIEIPQIVNMEITDSEGTIQQSTITLQSEGWITLNDDISMMAPGYIRVKISASDRAGNITIVNENINLSPILAGPGLNGMLLSDVNPATTIEIHDYNNSLIICEDKVDSYSTSRIKSVGPQLENVSFQLYNDEFINVNLLDLLFFEGKYYYVTDKTQDGFINNADKVDYSWIKNLLDTSSHHNNPVNSPYKESLSNSNYQLLLTDGYLDYTLVLPIYEDVKHLSTSHFNEVGRHLEIDNIWVASDGFNQPLTMHLKTGVLQNNAEDGISFLVFEVIIA